MIQDGHFNFNIKDKQLAVLIFENSISDDFFEHKKNLVNFCQALPLITQNKIIQELNLDVIKSIEWNERTFEYFHTSFGLNERFKFNSKSPAIIAKVFPLGLSFKIKALACE
jgi:hypothetical protein